MPDWTDFLQGVVGQNSPGALQAQRLGEQQIAGNQQQLQAGRLQLAAAQQKQDREASYEADVQAYYENPTRETLGRLAVKYPDKAEVFKGVYAGMDAAAKTSVQTQYGGLYNAGVNGRADLAATLIEQIRKAEGSADPEVDDMLGQLRSQDPAVRKAALRQVQGFAQLHLAAADPAKFSDVFSAVGKPREGFKLGQGDTQFDADGITIASVAPADKYLVVPEGGKAIPLNGAKPLGMEGGGLTSSGAAAGTNGDVSRLINTDAGGGYVPESVKTLGQFVGFGKSLNQRGAKSSSAGTYQINGSTMAEFGPKALGPDWKQAPFNAETQERVGESIFNWAKQQRDPAAALRGRWVSLSPKAAEQLAQGDWSQARGVIAQGETGGAPSASANRGPQSGDPAGTVYGAPKRGYQVLRPEEVPPGLDPNTVYQRGPDGNITPVGGQKQGQLKPWPVPALQARVANDAALVNINGALSLLNPANKTPEAKAAQGAVGFGTGWLGNRMTNWNDPAGTDFRARIGQIGGIQIKDTSGAAVSLSEDERLAKWVPKVDDAPGTIRSKLNNLRREIAQRNDVMENTYTEDQGFRPLHQQAGSARPMPKVGQVVKGYRFEGGNPADRNSWVRAQ